MVRSRKHSPRSIVLKQQVQVEVTEARFHTFESVRQLDVARLSRAAHARFEVGRFESGCCRRIVHAVVRKGMVVKLELEPCKDPVRVTPELKKTIQAAQKALAARRSRSTSLPLPVNQFLAVPMEIRVSIWACFKICAFGHCIVCCFHIPGVGSKWIWADCAIDRIPMP